MAGKKLIEVVDRTTARYEDLPARKSPLKEITDFEWRQALAIVQEHREDRAAQTVDRFVESTKAKQAHDDLTYVLGNHEYVPVDRLPYYIELLKRAERNYIAIADALEAERQRMSSQKLKGVGS